MFGDLLPPFPPMVFDSMWVLQIPIPSSRDFKAKYEMYSAFHNFKTQPKLHLNCKLKTLKTYWGREFRSITSPLHIFGVFHQLSCLHTP